MRPFRVCVPESCVPKYEYITDAASHCPRTPHQPVYHHGAAAGPLSLQGEFYADYSVLTARGTAPPQAAGRAAPSVLVAEPPAVEAPPARTRCGGGRPQLRRRVLRNAVPWPGRPRNTRRYEQQPGYYRPAEPAYGGQDQTEPGRYPRSRPVPA
jgi:hypothetical protein